MIKSFSAIAETLKCPGVCTEGHACSTTLNETDCEHDMVCCVDHFEDITTTEFADFDFTTEGTVETTSEDETTPEYETSETSYTYATEAGAEESEEYTYVYSDGMEDMVAEPVDEITEESEQCPGACVSLDIAESCDYVMATDSICPSGSTCCLSETDVEKTNEQYTYELQDDASIVERDTEAQSAEEACPGTCVHPSHAMFCEEVLPQFSCPLNSKCCVQRSMERALPDTVVQCSGQCLPQHMYGYCFPPNELVMGATTCPRATACCMIQSANQPNPPSVNRMKFPNFPKKNIFPNPSQVVLGHLAIDDAGTVYKVSTNGQIYPLPTLNALNRNRGQYTKLTSYQRVDGEIAIYSDVAGGLYQQFFPRQPTFMADSSSNQQRPHSPLLRQPVYQFESQASEHASNLKEPSTPAESSEEVLEDIIIPDDDDEAPVTTNTPVVHDEKNSRPPCPGSCMSYFLRFTCFRGYATYDGFTCPGRSVCCARLKDIEDHEQYLKSLSPYFNVPRKYIQLVGIGFIL